MRHVAHGNQIDLAISNVGSHWVPKVFDVVGHPGRIGLAEFEGQAVDGEFGIV